MEEDSRIESAALENEDIIPNVNYTSATTDNKFQNKQEEKYDDNTDHIITDEKSKQVLIQKERKRI